MYNHAVYRVKHFLKNFIFRRELIPSLSESERSKRLKALYKKRMKADLDLWCPKLFTEKIQWLKLYGYKPEMKRCVDKVAFKNYVNEKIGFGYVVPLIAVWENPSQVSIRSIPAKKFVIKSNVGGDGNFIKIVTDRDKLDIPTLEREIKTRFFDASILLTNSFCSAYWGIAPKVVVEEYVEEFSEGGVNDYKFLCFHGEPKYCYVAEDHFHNGQPNPVNPITMLDLNWNVLNVTYGDHMPNPSIARPQRFEEMILLAKELAKEFDFVRVDFFSTKEKLYISELTFYPGGGLLLYNPESFNREMGDLLHLPTDD